ncbi:MAG: hypothetical protein PHQ66_00780 [Candidatus Nanoarchaeia archaeon]|nr:hypothetical protein [Candidatus Nanoarchaeia archaeon]MDD5358487.1 hypothetical protein [Candidatus Nanoarchaeia archaeon]MDD5589001.1 hypothetical protein [Candidatus Nanoarchaeia archaeon]
MKYPLDEILGKIIKKENQTGTGIWEWDSENYRGGKLNIKVEGSEKLRYTGITQYDDKNCVTKFGENFSKEFGNLKITTSQIKGMGYFPTIAGYEAIVSNLKTLNPDYLIFKMSIQEKAPSGKIIIPQNKNEVFSNIMTDVASFLEKEYPKVY